MTAVHSDSSTSTVLEKQKKSVLILQRVPTGTGVVCQSIAPNMPFKVCMSVCRAHIIKITDQFRDMWPAMQVSSSHMLTVTRRHRLREVRVRFER